MPRVVLGCVLFALFGVSPVSAVDVVVSPRMMAAPSSDSEPPPVRVHYDPAGRVARDSSRAGEASGTIATTAGDSETIGLSGGGLWSLRASAEGFWGPEVFVTAEETGGPVILPLYPTGEVRIPIERRALGDTPTEIDVRFEPTPPRRAPDAGARGQVECPVEAGTARCEVPAGTMDLRLSMPPWTPAYRLGVVVDPQSTADLEPIELIRGASISGWVTREDGDDVPENASIELDLAGLGEAAESPESRLGLVRQQVKVGERGFFQFRGVRPGVYDVTARCEGFAPGRQVQIEARPDLESSLSDPLVLTAPVEVRLTLDPPVDPWGELWRARWSHVATDEDRTYSFDDAEVPEDGVLIVKGLSSGTYRISVEGPGESRWLQQKIDLHPGATDHFLSIPLVGIFGSVTRGAEAVSGRLSFGGRDGVRSIGVDLDEDGRFTGYLPSAGRWQVEWTDPGSEDTVALRPVEVPDESRSRLDLEIPDTELVGEVVDQHGRPAAAAKVRAIGVRDEDDRSIHAEVQTDDDGRFHLSGLEPGTYGVAASAGGAESGMMEIELSEELAPPEVRLVLRGQFRMSGRVTSGGSLVPGAKVVTWPAFAGSAGATLQETYTGPNGFFDVEVSGEPGLFHFLVTAPGYAVHMGAAQASSARDLVELTLEVHPGTLFLDLSVLRGDTVLSHSGTFFPVQAFLRFAFPGRPPQITGDTLIVPGVEPGEYALCDTRAMLAAGGAEGDACRTGVLAPYGELRLSLPEAGGDARAR